MENILIILQNKTEKNATLINDCNSLIKTKGGVNIKSIINMW